MPTSSPATSPGCRSSELCAELSTFVAGRRLDDNVQVLLRFADGARGALWASQVAPGNENNLRLRVYGSRGGLEWHQEQPNQLAWSPFGQPTQTIARATGAAGAAAARVTRIPAGHPEGYLEAFATLYGEIAQAIRAAPSGAARRPTVRSSFPASPMASRRRVHRGRGRVSAARRALGAPAAARSGRASIETLIDLFIDVMRLPASHPIAACLPRPPSLKSPRAPASARPRSIGCSTSARASTPTRCSACCRWSPRSARRRSAAGRAATPTSRFAFVLPADDIAVPRAGRPPDRAVGRRFPPPAHHRGHLPPRRRRRRRSSPPSLAQVGRVRGRRADGARPAAGQAARSTSWCASGVHVVTLFSDVAGSMRETHVGADSRAAGRTAGLLLGRMASGTPRDTLLLSSQATRLSAEIERRIGFAQVLEERFPTLRMLRLPDLPADDDGDAARARALPAEGHRPGARRRPLQRRLGQRRAGARAGRRRPGRRRRRWPRTT